MGPGDAALPVRHENARPSRRRHTSAPTAAAVWRGPWRPLHGRLGWSHRNGTRTCELQSRDRPCLAGRVLSRHLVDGAGSVVVTALLAI